MLCLILVAGMAIAVPVMARPARKSTYRGHVWKGHPSRAGRRHHRRKRSRPRTTHKPADTTKTTGNQSADAVSLTEGAEVAAATADPTPKAAPRLVLSEEFNGSAGSSPNPNDWNFDTGGKGWGNQELESYTSRLQNAELDGKGDLDITARSEDYIGSDGIPRQYTSARLQTLHKFQFQYGLVEARIQVPAGKGLWPAFWLLGDEAYANEHTWPYCGEIDAMEVLGSEPNIVHGTLHAAWPWAPKDGMGGSAASSTPLSAGFHVYGVEWAPQRISFLLDGTVYKTITPADLPPGAPWPFDHPFFLLLNLAVGGDWPGAPNASTQFPAHMLVDWVRVWQ
jgi:beta-glucanase (GH16 family)